MKAQKVIKFIWEELVSFLAWSAPALWKMFSGHKIKEEEVHVTGVIETEDGYLFTMYSDGTTESGPAGVKGPFV